jgi:hypothetical protein
VILLEDPHYAIVESAAVLRILYGRFIEVWRQKEAIVQSNRMTRLLIRNAGHEGEVLLPETYRILMALSTHAFEQHNQLFRGSTRGHNR